MDFIKKVAGNHGSDSSSNTAGGSAPVDGQQPPQQQKDYGDKIADAILDKTGYGNKVSDANREKMTDFAREKYEKQTGNKVDPKWSN